MGAISYARSPLAVLQISSSTVEEILDFLNLHSSQSYERIDDTSGQSSPIRVRSLSDCSTIISLQSDTLLVHDPDRGGVAIIQSMVAIERFGIDGDRLRELLAKVAAKAIHAP